MPVESPDKRPLIAHVIYRLDIGGLENGLVNLINRLSEDRYRHVILCLKGYSEFRNRIRRRDVEVIDLKKQEGKDPQLYLRLWRLFRKLKPDIVHTRNLSTLPAVVPAFLAGVSVRIHGEHGRDMGDLDGSNSKNRLLRRFFKPFVSHFIALSRDLESYLIHAIGVPKQKISQIYNGVDTKLFYPGRETESPLPFTESRLVVIGTVGRMQAVKDQLTLTRAFILLLEQAPQWRQCARLIMIGDGPLRNQSMALLESAGLSDYAWLPGARDDVARLLRHMDIFVLPSLAEGISNTILEAMASGLPVIATRVGGNGELVDDQNTGALVSSNDPVMLSQKILAYLNHPTLATTHGFNAREKTETRFSIDTMVRGYARIYDDAVLQVSP